MQREQRKLEHIKYALELGDGPATTHFADLHFVHNCLPEINPADIDISVKLLGKRLRLPFFIDAEIVYAPAFDVVKFFGIFNSPFSHWQ